MIKDINLFKQRLMNKGETPPFFKRWRKYAFIGACVVSGVAAGFYVADMPKWTLAIAVGIDTMLGTFLGSTYLPTTNKELSGQ